MQDIEVQADNFEDEQNLLNELNESIEDVEFLLQKSKEHKDLLWKCHPDNPNSLGVEYEYNLLENYIENLENKLGI